MHKLLERQLRRYIDSAAIDSLPRNWQQFVLAVNAAYEQADADHQLIERSIELVSQELLERNQALVRSNLELQQFAYVASHDLQEPLRMVSGYMQLLTRRYKPQLDTDAQEFIAYAVDGVQRMQGLINDLLTYSRVETRQRPLEPVVMTDVLRQAVTNLQVAIAESKAMITHDPLPTVLGDPAQLVQVFQNLLGNAIKFRKPDQEPRIHVAAVRRGQEWRLAVQDNGIGLDPQYADRIFVIFQRLHTASEYPGTGIGLAICKKIIERHNGRIWVESEPGHGTSFLMTLAPVVEAHHGVPSGSDLLGLAPSVAGTAHPRSA